MSEKEEVAGGVSFESALAALHSNLETMFGPEMEDYQPMEAEYKPGWKTSEGWLAALVTLLSFLTANGWLSAAEGEQVKSVVVEAGPYIIIGLSVVGYIWSRVQVKVAKIKSYLED